MREIKFRAWDAERKEMFFPSQLVTKTYKRGQSSEMTTQRYTGDNYAVLMQCVGLKDDNGVEIYEGDIVTNIKGELLEVEWNDDTCKWQLSNGDDINDGETYSSYKVVIGNIYETPELLNKPQTEQA